MMKNMKGNELRIFSKCIISELIFLFRQFDNDLYKVLIIMVIKVVVIFIINEMCLLIVMCINKLWLDEFVLKQCLDLILGVVDIMFQLVLVQEN